MADVRREVAAIEATITAEGVMDLALNWGIVDVGGTASLSSLGTASIIGTRRMLRFNDPCTLVQTTDQLTVPGGVTTSVSAGDIVEFLAVSATEWRVLRIMRNNGQFLSGGAGTASVPAFGWSGDPGTGTFSPASQQWALTLNGVEAARVRRSAFGGVNFGIGTTTPADNIGGTSASAWSTITLQGVAGGVLDLRGSAAGAKVGRVFTNYTNVVLECITQSASVLTALGYVALNDTGGFGVNTLNGKPISIYATAQFCVVAASALDGMTMVGNGTNNMFNMIRPAGAANTTMLSFASGTTGTSIIGSITTVGSGTQFNTSSDYRIKTIIADHLPDAAHRVMRLKPLSFVYNADPFQLHAGFLAHEVADIAPYAVTGEKDAVGANGEVIPQQLDHSKLVPLLTAALQNALRRIDALEARVAHA